MKKIRQKGFTLIELILVIAIIIIIAAAIFVALNPAKRIGDANDSQRWSEVNSVLGAIQQSIVDNTGTFPNQASWAVTNYYQLGTDGVGCDNCAAQATQGACLNLTDLTTNNYLGSIPIDPTIGTAGKTGYYVQRTAGGIVTVGACSPYSGTISVQR